MDNQKVDIKKSGIYDKMEVFILVAVSIILFISIIYLLHSYSSPDIKGFWELSKDFCEKSGADDMYIFLGNKKSTGFLGSHIRFGYIVSIIEDKPETSLVKAEFKPKSFFTTFNKLKNYIYYDLIFTDEDGNDIELDFPSKLECMIDKGKGKMVFYKEKKLYGIFYKNNEITDDEELDLDC